MTESTVSDQIPQRWYARPVFFVSDVQGAFRFYIDKLGFGNDGMKPTARGKSAKSTVGSAKLSCVRMPRRDKGRLFVELTRDGLDELRREISERSVPTQKAWWG